jgi:hypothetical protein
VIALWHAMGQRRMANADHNKASLASPTLGGVVKESFHSGLIDWTMEH